MLVMQFVTRPLKYDYCNKTFLKPGRALPKVLKLIHVKPLSRFRVKRPS